MAILIKDFEKKFPLLKEYVELRGNYPPSYGGYYKGEIIGDWYRQVRNIYIHGVEREDGSLYYDSEDGGILTKEQIDLLNEMKFEWIHFLGKKYFFGRSISDEEKYKAVRRYLTEELNRIIDSMGNLKCNDENILILKKEFDKKIKYWGR